MKNLRVSQALQSVVWGGTGGGQTAAERRGALEERAEGRAGASIRTK